MCRRLPLLVVVLLFVAATAAQATDLARFNAAVAAVNAHYRGALFYLRTGNPAVAEFELQQADDLWRERVLPFRDAAPDAFAADPDWASTLDAIEARLRRGRGLAQDDPKAAQAELEPIMDLLASLRARNGVRVFSDCIAEAAGAMDALWAFRHEPPDFTDATAVNALRAQTAVTAYLYQRCQSEAPPQIAAAPEFQRLMEGTRASLQRLWPAIDAGDAERVISILREVRSFDRMLWLQFG